MASWQHRAVVQKQDVKKLQKSGREPHGRIEPRMFSLVLCKVGANASGPPSFTPSVIFLSGFDITDGFKSIDLPWG